MESGAKSKKLEGEIFLKCGLFFGKFVVRILEWMFPSFRDKDENLNGFKNGYLEKFNLSNKERFKREFKAGLIIIITMLFWAYMITLIANIFSVFNLAFHVMLFTVIFVLFVIFMLLYIYNLHKEIYG